MTRSPAEVVRTYLDEVWHNENLEILPELLSDKCWRHDSYDVDNQLICLDLEEQIARVKDGLSQGAWRFPIVKLLEDDEYATLIYDCTLAPKTPELLQQLVEKYDAIVDDQGRMLVKGIEVFRVVEGKIVEIWNAQHWMLRGSWGATMSL